MFDRSSPKFKPAVRSSVFIRDFHFAILSAQHSTLIVSARALFSSSPPRATPAAHEGACRALPGTGKRGSLLILKRFLRRASAIRTDTCIIGMVSPLREWRNRWNRKNHDLLAPRTFG